MFKVNVTAKVKVSVNVSLDDILCVAEPFVTKPSIHHYKPECHVQKKWVKVKVKLTEFRFIL